MLLFLDTEFTDFSSLGLISLGIVSESGETFYAEHTSFDRKVCSHFVNEVVIPQLGNPNVAQFPTITRIRDELLLFLQQWQHEQIVFAVDHEVDWWLVQDVLGWRLPDNVSGVNIVGKLDQIAKSNFYLVNDLLAHHALNDAMANKYAYRM